MALTSVTCDNLFHAPIHTRFYGVEYIVDAQVSSTIQPRDPSVKGLPFQESKVPPRCKSWKFQDQTHFPKEPDCATN